MADSHDHRVLRFRPRTSQHPPSPSRGAGAADDVTLLHGGADEPDDFRHRMLANLAAFAFTVLLIAIGIWLAFKISDLRRTQDCVLMGRRDCAPIAASHS